MRRVPVSLTLLALCVSLCGCENSSSPCECSQQNAVTGVWAYHEDELALATASRDVATSVNGVVFADPLPTLQSVELNDAEFSDPGYWQYIDGYIYFGSWDYEIVIYSGFDPIVVSVRTSAGDVEGAVSLPDEITHLEFSESLILELGEPLTISWPGQDADFYHFWLYYEWGGWEYSVVDTVVSGNSVTIDGSFFSHDGVIWDVWIQPTNGPMPKPGATGNMSGYGSGYLYYSRDEYYEEVGILVGQGPEREARRSIARSSGERRATAQRTIRRMLGLPVQLER